MKTDRQWRQRIHASVRKVSLIDLFIFGDFVGEHFVFPPWLCKPKKAKVNRVKCVTKIDGTTIYDAEDLDLVMSMYNLLEYNLNYSDTTSSILKMEVTDFNDIADNDFKSFKYKAKLIGNTEADRTNGILRNTTIAVS